MAGIIQYYFMLGDDISDFGERMASPLEAAGFKVISGGNDNGLHPSSSFSPVYWQFAALGGSHVWALTFSSEGGLKEAQQYLQALEEQAGVDLDMILGQATVVVAAEHNWDELLIQAAALMGRVAPEEVALRNGRLLRYALSPTQACYLSPSEVCQTNDTFFWRQGLAQIEAQQLNAGIVGRLLRDQLTQVKRESTTLERELSLILHANLVSAQGAQKEADELDTQLNTLISSYGKIVGSRHLVAQSRVRLLTLVNQLNRQLRQDSVLDPVQPLFDRWMEGYQESLDELSQVESGLEHAQRDYLAGIEVVRSRIDMMNNRSNLATQAQIRALMEQNTEMQKQSLVFQYAAGLIEFIVLAYYSHSLWKNLAHDSYLLIPSSIQFAIVLLFSGCAVYCTHLLAEYMQGEHEVRGKMIAALIVMAALLLIIIIGTIITGPAVAIPGVMVGH